MRRTLTITALAAAVGLLVAGCASTASAPAQTTPAAEQTQSAVSGTVTVLAAASLKGAFDELAKDFQVANPAVTIAPIQYDGSSTLATQINEGAPADVFASADEANMAKVVDAGNATGPSPFASNTLTIVVPKGNPGGITQLSDLATAGKTVVLCAAEVPCGRASTKLLDAQQVAVTPASSEQNVTAVLTKVAAGEADAGLVYVTDAKTTTDVETVETAGAADVVNTYPIVTLKHAASAAAADAFVQYVLGAQGQKVLASYGFAKP